MTHLVPTTSSLTSIMNSIILPSFIPISDVFRLVEHITGSNSLESAFLSGVMPETRKIINESKEMIQIKTEIDGDVSQKILSRQKWEDIKSLFEAEPIVVGYEEDDEKIYGQDFLDCTREESVHPDMIIKMRMNLIDRFKDDHEGPIESMLELVTEHQDEKLKEMLAQRKEIERQKNDKEKIRMRLLTTDRPQNITVKKVDGLYIVQNSFRFVLDPPKERLVIGIYNPDKTIRTKLSDEEITTCTMLKLKIKGGCLPGWMEKDLADQTEKKNVTVEEEKEIQPPIPKEKIVVEEKAEPSDDDLSPFDSPTHSNVHPHPMFTAKSHHKYVSYLNILSMLYNTDDGLDEEVWTDDLVARVDARLHGPEIGYQSTMCKIETLRNMGTSYNEVYITSKNQPNKRPYKILSDHTLTDILEGTRVFAGNNKVIDYFEVNDSETTNSVLSLIINWLP